MPGPIARSLVLLTGLVTGLGLACGDDVTSDGGGSATGSETAVLEADAEQDGAGTEASGGDSEPADLDALPVLDLAGPDLCQPSPDSDAIVICAPGPSASGSPIPFEPAVQWTFTDPYERASYVTPLVANLTDDDDNGVVDLCDTPDVVLVAAANPGLQGAVGHIFVLSGDTGALHFRIPTDVDANFTPALGDIDHDGRVEIVTLSPDGGWIAFAHDGAVEWTTPASWGPGPWFELPLSYAGSAALADLDHDGDVEIVSANLIVDHEGAPVQTLPTGAGQWGATTLADLDDDDDLEIVLGSAAYHHDGALAWDTQLAPGYPQVADLDDDALPEVLLTNASGLALIEHDGTVTFESLRPNAVPIAGTYWHRPATIHDFDGDDQPELALGSGPEFSVVGADASVVWSAIVGDESGIAGATAFDLFGTGTATAIYADEQHLWVFDGVGLPLWQAARPSGTLTEYPVVADIDDDGSAELLVVANPFGPQGADYACLRAIRDAHERWMPARRIWNQHSYHVSNVREDGSIPQFEPKSWAQLNTFRAQAPILDGVLCEPG